MPPLSPLPSRARSRWQRIKAFSLAGFRLPCDFHGHPGKERLDPARGQCNTNTTNTVNNTHTTNTTNIVLILLLLIVV